MDVPSSTEKRTALVTGASFGIGAAIALELARDGFDLAITATLTENLEATLSKLNTAGCRATVLELNLRSTDSIERTADEAVRELRRLDVLVNNAAVPFRKAAVDVSPKEWNDVMEVNAAGTFFLSQRIAKRWIDGKRPGCIINMASTYGVVGYSGVSVYGISKAAVVHMTKMLAVEWAGYGIRVNAVAPGTVETDSRATTLADPQYRQSILDKVPLHRFGTPEEIAAAVRYLASPAAAYVTGQLLLVDGGLSACGSRGTGAK